MQTIRPAAVAGMFYPGEAHQLRTVLQACLAEAEARTAVRPKMLLVPHAGYVYSGPIAGHAYAQLGPWARSVRRVVLLGPAHRVALRGLAAPTVDAFETPLGRIPLDQAALRSLADLPQVVRDDHAHAQEHSLEVQLPFLQALLRAGFELVPLVVGRTSVDEVAEVLERLWGDDGTLIVISTDLSHYLPYADAQAIDRATVARITAMATDIDPHEACGAHAVNGALLAARRHGLVPQLLDLRNSGDTAGDRSRVVGYASVALVPRQDQDADEDDTALGVALVARAHNAIAAQLGQPLDAEPDHPGLGEKGATFVTLHDARGALRGCIGGLQAVEPLADDVRHHAEAAAFRDPRFPPLSAAEWPGLRIEVSLLEPPAPLPPVRTRAEALAQLEPGVDGVILSCQGRRATFLPQVWEQLPGADAFLGALMRKAGLPPDHWSDDVRLSRYRVRKFARAAVAGPYGH